MVPAELFTGVIAAMQGEHSSQGSFFGMSYEDLIPADHLLRKLATAVDFSFVCLHAGV